MCLPCFCGATCACQLLDFGGAKVTDGLPKAVSRGLGHSLCEAHSVTGTLLFAAPEVFKGFYSWACDLWSCGIVIFLLISGHLPFQADLKGSESLLKLDLGRHHAPVHAPRPRVAG